MAGGVKHQAAVKEVELQVSVGSSDRINRALIIHPKNWNYALWVIAPDTELITNAKPILHLDSNGAFDQVVASLRTGTASVTWWEAEDVISRLVVSVGWDYKGQRNAGGMGFGFGLAVPMGS